MKTILVLLATLLALTSSVAAQVHGRADWRLGARHFEQQIDEHDTLVLARMLIGSQTAGARQAGQTGRSDAAACRLWTALNRFAMTKTRGAQWRSVAHAAESYSTAINPRWQRGAECSTGARASTSFCSERRLARRARVSTMTWEQIGTQFGDLRGYVQTWARGDVSPPDGCETTVHTDGLWRTVASRFNPVRYGSNWFWEVPWWQTPVTLHPPRSAEAQ